MKGLSNVKTLLPPHALCTSQSVTLTDWTRLCGHWCQSAAQFTHDIIAFMACDIDVDSTGSTDDEPSLSFCAIQSALSTMDALLQFNAMKM